MAFFRVIIAVIFNRYLLAFAAFLVWMLFFDRNDFSHQLRKTSELNELNLKIEYYTEEIAQSEAELLGLQNDPAILEKYAREKYFMKRDNEDIFLFEPAAPATQ